LPAKRKRGASDRLRFTPPTKSPGATPGELYREIRVPREEFKGEEGLVKKEIHPFVVLCRRVHKRAPTLGAGAKYSEEFKHAIDFLDWPLKPEEFDATVKATLIATLVIGFAIGIVVAISPVSLMITEAMTQNDYMTLIYIFGPFVAFSLTLTYLVQNYPLSQAKAEQVKALTYVPEIVGYMTMSMKLVPNLEKAVEFSAEHGKGKIASDLKELIWNVQIGVYGTLSEGLDDLAYRWGKYSTEFKEALMKIRASVLEATEAKRYALLDQTMENVLTSIREKMEGYARGLSQPSIVLFYLGVLLPLILIIILPVGSSFTGQALARPEFMALIYNVLIPGGSFAFAYYVVNKRPPTYKSPVIPDDHPRLFGKYKMKVGKQIIDVRHATAAIFLIGLMVSFFVSTQGIPPKFLMEEGAPQLFPSDKSEADVLSANGYPLNYFNEGGVLENRLVGRGFSPERAQAVVKEERVNFYFQPQNDTSPFNLVFGLILTMAFCAAFFLYFSTIYKKRIQDDYVQMESEFNDALYVLASRLGENKPVEEALKHARDFLPNYKISQAVFGKTVDNITLMGLSLEPAIFDPVYGALKDNPSTVLRGSLKLMVDSVKLGVNVAARTLMSLSLQLSNSQKVTKMLAQLIGELTSMMSTMSIFIAPIVLGITTSLQKVVMVTLSQIASGPTSPTSNISSLDVTSASQLGNLGGIMQTVQGFTQQTQAISLDRAVLASLADPTQFLLIVAIYVIELVIVMVYFTTKIEEDNNLKVKLNLAYALPIATVIFLATMIFANSVVGAFFA
jgi:hypothetical protein